MFAKLIYFGSIQHDPKDLPISSYSKGTYMKTTSPLDDRVQANAKAAFELLVRFRNFVTDLELPSGQMQLEADQLFSDADNLLESVFRFPQGKQQHFESASETVGGMKRRYE